MSKKLQRKYYSRKIKGLWTINPCNWWPSVKLVTGQKTNISSHLYFLNQLKQSGIGSEDHLCFYTTAICAVAEYACPAVWHLSLTAAQTKALKSLQWTAMKTVFPDNDYSLSLHRQSQNALVMTGVSH